MILIFPDGSRIVLPGVGLQALSGNAPIINFSDRSIDARELLGMLGEVREVGPGARLSMTSADEEVPPSGEEDGSGLQATEILEAEREREEIEAEQAQNSSSMAQLAQNVTPPPPPPSSSSSSSGSPAPPPPPLGPITADALLFRVNENSPRGTSLGSVLRAAPEAVSGVIFRLVDDAGGRFRIDATTGEITVADGVLDYETARTHTLLVEAQAGGVIQQVTLAIALGDINEAPTALEMVWQRAVAENSPAGVGAALIRAVDPDLRDRLTYSLVDSADGRFEIDPTSGLVRVRAGATLDYEAQTSFPITVRVTDAAGNTLDANFVLDLTDVNEAPTAPVLISGGAVNENAAAGTEVAQFAATDPDAGDVLIFSLADNAGGRFVIDAQTGVVTVAEGAELNHETSPSHRIVVRATDSGGLQRDTLVTISVGNVEEAPQDLILAGGGSVVEGAARGEFVGVAQAFDPDRGDRLTYSLTDNAGGRFSIDAQTGAIRVADNTRIDADTTQAYAITVQATDRTGAVVSQTFSIAVEAANETPFDLRLVAGGGVVEMAASGVLVARVAAQDPDANDILTYSLADDAGGLFVIDGVSGEIRVAEGAVLDFETQAFHDLTVAVRDAGGLEATTRVRITVANVNEAPSEVSFSWGGDVPELTLVGQAVGQVRAIDPDAGDR
ncbi:MAG: cadherin repeat domain-containing protein, partial [Alphaproteobacteria bacterium]|nr:cadherin repeat domain-containing protein [Alphaproteobacteria bacterium]